MEEQIKKFLKQLRLNESFISSILGVLVIIVVGVLLYNYFRGRASPSLSDSDLNLNKDLQTQPQKETVSEGKTPEGLPTKHVVSKGESLWTIAQQYYGSGYNWVDIASANSLKHPNQLVEGTQLTIPNVPAKKLTNSLMKESSNAMAPSITSTNTTMSISESSYTVQEKDSLWSVAVRAYGDGYQWPKLYQANRESIGRNPNRLEQGITLQIPRN